MDTRLETSLTIGSTAFALVWRRYLGISPETPRHLIRARVPTPTLVEKRKSGVAAVVISIPDPAEMGECSVLSGVEISLNAPTWDRKYPMTTTTKPGLMTV